MKVMGEYKDPNGGGVCQFVTLCHEISDKDQIEGLMRSHVLLVADSDFRLSLIRVFLMCRSPHYSSREEE